MEFPKYDPCYCTQDQVRNSRSTPSTGQVSPIQDFGFGQGAPFREPAPNLHLEFLEFSEKAVGLSHGFCIQLASIRFPAALARLKWGCSSAGRAPDLHSGGRRFDPDQLHQFILGLLLSWLERTPDKGEVGSSNLPRPTKIMVAQLKH